MIVRVFISLLVFTLLLSCSKMHYCFNEHLTEDYEPKELLDQNSLDSLIDFNRESALYFLAMKRTKIFQDGELSFKISASFDPDEPCNQFACFVFDSKGRVYYFTKFRDDIMKDLEDSDDEDGRPPMKDTIVVREFRNAMQGRYAMNGDNKILMILEKWGQDHPITLIGHVKNYSLTLDLINFTRETFPAIQPVELDGNEVDGEDGMQLRYYDLKELFTIDTMQFKYLDIDPPVISYEKANQSCYHDTTFWDKDKVERYLGVPPVIPKYEINQMRQSR